MQQTCNATYIPGRQVFVQKWCQLVVPRCHREQRVPPLICSKERAVIGSPCCPSLLLSSYNCRGRKAGLQSSCRVWGKRLCAAHLQSPIAGVHSCSDHWGGGGGGGLDHGCICISAFGCCLVIALVEARRSRRKPLWQVFEMSP